MGNSFCPRQALCAFSRTRLGPTLLSMSGAEAPQDLSQLYFLGKVSTRGVSRILKVLCKSSSILRVWRVSSFDCVLDTMILHVPRVAGCLHPDGWPLFQLKWPCCPAASDRVTCEGETPANAAQCAATLLKLARHLTSIRHACCSSTFIHTGRNSTPPEDCTADSICKTFPPHKQLPQ